MLIGAVHCFVTAMHVYGANFVRHGIQWQFNRGAWEENREFLPRSWASIPATAMTTTAVAQQAHPRRSSRTVQDADGVPLTPVR
jgi:hypothetical protein